METKETKTVKQGDLLAEFANADDGVAGLVVAGINGAFNVCLKDLDSGEIVPSVTVYPPSPTAYDRACAKAEQIAFGK